MPLPLVLYNALLLISAPLWLLPVLVWSCLRWRRSGTAGPLRARDAALLAGRPVVWMHCASLGESAVGAILHRRFAPRLPAAAWVLTSFTSRGLANLGRLLGQEGICRRFPLDLPWTVRTALRVARPSLVVLVEAEFWPNFIHAAHRRGAKVAVVNGRISDRSMRRYSRLRWFLRPLLGEVDLFVMQSPLDARRIVSAGAPEGRVRVSGNLKFDFVPPPAAVLCKGSLGLADVPVLVAGSTHRGEEEILLQAYRDYLSSGMASLILAPRHLERLPEVRSLVVGSGLRSGMRSEARQGECQVLLVDTYGELPSFYRLATVVFIGGSLVPIGGHNPIEASVLGLPVLFGPHMENFREAAALLLDAGAAWEVHSAEEITRALQKIIPDSHLSGTMGESGRAVIAANQGAAERSADWLAPLLGPGDV